MTKNEWKSRYQLCRSIMNFKRCTIKVDNINELKHLTLFKWISENEHPSIILAYIGWITRPEGGYHISMHDRWAMKHNMTLSMGVCERIRLYGWSA